MEFDPFPPANCVVYPYHRNTAEEELRKSKTNSELCKIR